MVNRLDQTALPVSRSSIAFLSAVPIAIVGGLIGLGGAEFRLPVLAGPLGYTARQAVPINLAVSLVTLAASLANRASNLGLGPLVPFAPPILAMIAGGAITAFLGPALAARLSNRRLNVLILSLLVATESH